MKLKSWETIRREVAADDRDKFDLTVFPAGIKWVEDDKDIYLSVDPVGSFSLSPWAESQICGRFGMPVGYYRRVPADLKAMQLDYWIDRKCRPQERWLLRCRGGTVRGILSSNYYQYDNNRILGLWEKTGLARQYSYQLLLTDVSFYLRAVRRNQKKDSEDSADNGSGIGSGRSSRAVNGGLSPAVNIVNSEVGRRGISIQAGVWRKVCSNGLVIPVRRALFYHRHLWIDETELEEKFREAVAEATDASRKSLRRLSETASIPAGEQDLLGELSHLEPSALRGGNLGAALRSFREEGELNYFGVINALTSLARKLPPDQRFEVESRAGTLLSRAR